MDCLFCSIAAKKIEAQIVYEDEQVVAFHDIAPQAPVHVLIIPKKHIATINEVGVEDSALLGHIMLIAKKLAKELEVDEPGYRLVFNVNKAGCQAVYHIHLHLIGGRQMAWPPG